MSLSAQQYFIKNRTDGEGVFVPPLRPMGKGIDKSKQQTIFGKVEEEDDDDDEEEEDERRAAAWRRRARSGKKSRSTMCSSTAV